MANIVLEKDSFFRRVRRLYEEWQVTYAVAVCANFGENRMGAATTTIKCAPIGQIVVNIFGAPAFCSAGWCCEIELDKLHDSIIHES